MEFPYSKVENACENAPSMTFLLLGKGQRFCDDIHLSENLKSWEWEGIKTFVTVLMNYSLHFILTTRCHSLLRKQRKLENGEKDRCGRYWQFKKMRIFGDVQIFHFGGQFFSHNFL
jgi:hypothetical protein